MVFSLQIHKDAKEDLDALWISNPEAAALIAVALQEIAADQRLLSGLLDHGFGAERTEIVEVKKWLEYWNQGSNLWRLKVWDMDRLDIAYRVIYAYEPRHLRHHVLGVFPRSFNYDRNDPRTKRVIHAYHNL